MKASSLEQIEGYAENLKEIEILQKYGNDRALQKGMVMDAVNMLHPKSIDLKVSRIIRETKSASTLRLVPQNGYLPPFQAGQYINVSVEINNIRTSRPYSISSPPSQTGFYDITVRQIENGFVSSYLTKHIKAGDKLTSSSPKGNFYHNPVFHGTNLVFIAGGSGITPFMSMIREVTDRGLDRQILLIYGSRLEDDIVFLGELADRSSFADQFKVVHVISQPSQGYKGIKGFITKELIQDLADKTGQQTFYICGPPAMSDYVSKALKDLSIPPRQIRKEVFGPPVDVTQEPGWPDNVNANDQFEVSLSCGKSITAKAYEPLMNSLEKAGLTIAASCRSGECSLCRTRVLKGKVYHPQGVKLRKSDEKYNYIHPCMAYPLEDLELLL